MKNKAFSNALKMVCEKLNCKRPMYKYYEAESGVEAVVSIKFDHGELVERAEGDTQEEAKECVAFIMLLWISEIYNSQYYDEENISDYNFLNKIREKLFHNY